MATTTFARAFEHVGHELEAHTQLGNNPRRIRMVIRCTECEGSKPIVVTDEIDVTKHQWENTDTATVCAVCGLDLEEIFGDLATADAVGGLVCAKAAK